MGVPSGAKARFAANVAAIETVGRVEAEGRAATPTEREVLARWSSWGAIPEVFDEAKASWSAERARLRGLLDEGEWAAARRTTLNAHYTDPDYARAMWDTLVDLGFTGGTVLEPGSGLGTFIGLAPDGVEVTGVELDPMTARISRALYPHARVRAESFAETRVPEGSFDAAVGNVPFAQTRLHDPVHNPNGHSLHNHFIVKSLRLTRPGGMVAVLTSRYTMDAQNPAARREMAELADLVGAVRLPSGAHRRTAGADVVTDLLVLRRREPGREPVDTSWTQVAEIEVDGRPTQVGSYFTAHREHVLGEARLRSGRYGSDVLEVVADVGRTPTRLREALASIVASARESGLTVSARPAEAPSPEASGSARPPAEAAWSGTVVETSDGFGRVGVDGTVEPVNVAKKHADEVRMLMGLRDQATRLLELESSSRDDTGELGGARALLRTAYEEYVAAYGPVNRFTLRRTGRTDPETGEDKHAKVIPPAVRLFRKDPFGPVVQALELYDEQTQAARPARLLNERQLAPRLEVLGVDTPAEALAVSMDRTGGVDLELVASLLGVDEQTARRGLDGLVFDDPASGRLTPAPEYLSGDVRVKLERAREAAETDPVFAANVAALSEVLPEPLGVAEIEVGMGAAWLGEGTHEEFLKEVLADPGVRVASPEPGRWQVGGWKTSSMEATSVWGTDRVDAYRIAQAVMQNQVGQIVVSDTGRDGGKVVDVDATTAAHEKAAAMAERFSSWVWEDPERASRLVDEYNRRFNSIVLRDYSAAGEHLSLPGLAESFEPRPHQRSAVARMIAEPAAGLFHEVGAGKTAEMVMGTMELRRLGMVSKPVVVVPNHMLEQFTREWLQLYPRARLLAAGSADLSGDDRRMFVARAAAHDWDAVLMTHGSFKKVGLRAETRAAHVQREVDAKRAYLAASGAGEKGMSVKNIENRLAGAEENARRGLETGDKDAGLSFEDTGIDYVVVDELHTHKSIAIDSAIDGMSRPKGSAVATDLLMKLDYLRGQGLERVATGATATPLPNSVSEAFVMQRLLRPDLLESAGIAHFDQWAATFGRTVTEMEVTPTGADFKIKTRFASFQNVPEMLRMWSTFADVKTAEDLNLPTPELVRRPDGRRAPETVVVSPTVEQRDYIASLVERAEKVSNSRRAGKGEDNMLVITTDGRKVAMDPRMVDALTPGTSPSGPTKVDVAADRIHATWQRTRDNVYTDPDTGEPEPTPGGLQIVFSDLGMPNPGRWNVYEELKAQLVDRGMPAEKIRFIGEAKTDDDKARLFAAARSGHVSVLIGSTQKMGVGTNVQRRAVGLYHLDCPWRPSDIAQREGRIMRQGNQNPEVEIVRFVTEQSFDAYMWQTVERKAKFIGQVMRSRLDAREINELDDGALSAAEAKALSSGNPLLLEHAAATAEATRLRRLSRAHDADQARLVHTRDSALASQSVLSRRIEQLEAAAARVVDLTGDRFTMRVGGRTVRERSLAADGLRDAVVNSRHRSAMAGGRRSLGVIGSVSGFDVEAAYVAANGMTAIELRLAEVPGSGFQMTQQAFLGSGHGVVTRLENRVAGISARLDQTRRRLAEAEQGAERAAGMVGAPFKHADELAAAVDRLADVERRMGQARQESLASASPSGPGEITTPEPVASLVVGTRRKIRDSTQLVEAFDTAREDASVRFVLELDLPEGGGLTINDAPANVEVEVVGSSHVVVGGNVRVTGRERCQLVLKDRARADVADEGRVVARDGARARLSGHAQGGADGTAHLVLHGHSTAVFRGRSTGDLHDHATADVGGSARVLPHSDTVRVAASGRGRVVDRWETPASHAPGVLAVGVFDGRSLPAAPPSPTR
ncbi:MAG: helicase [Aeromicrobium sp.]|uniref:helicase n=1 Tax=Aeromicrobium sp. TaxID=1871063 RepID=UPI0039E6A1FA